MNRLELENIIRHHQMWIEYGDNYADGESCMANSCKRAVLHGKDLSGMDLSDIDLIGADLRDSNLRGADLRRTNFKVAELQRVDFRDAKFNDTEFGGAFLEEANFTGANLSQTNFFGCDLSKAILCDTKLNEAILQQTNMAETNLIRANLSNANLLYADLKNAKLNQTNLKFIKIDNITVDSLPDEILEKYANTFYVLGWFDDRENKIIRSIKFPPEHYESGLTILSYFGTIVRHKYKNIPVEVTIKQKDLKVTLIIDMPDGKKEEIEKTLEEYGMVVKDLKRPEDFTSDPFLLLDLKRKLDQAQHELYVERELYRSISNIKNDEILDMKEDIESLKSSLRDLTRGTEKKSYYYNINAKNIENFSQKSFSELGEGTNRSIKFGDDITIESGRNTNFLKDNSKILNYEILHSSINKSFIEVHDLIDKELFDKEIKNEIISQLKILEDESVNSSPNKGKIEKCINYIKKLAPEIVKAVPWKKLIEKIFLSI